MSKLAGAKEAREALGLSSWDVTTIHLEAKLARASGSIDTVEGLESLIRGSLAYRASKGLQVPPEQAALPVAEQWKATKAAKAAGTTGVKSLQTTWAGLPRKKKIVLGSIVAGVLVIALAAAAFGGTGCGSDYSEYCIQVANYSQHTVRLTVTGIGTGELCEFELKPGDSTGAWDDQPHKGCDTEIRPERAENVMLTLLVEYLDGDGNVLRSDSAGARAGDFTFFGGEFAGESSPFTGTIFKVTDSGIQARGYIGDHSGAAEEAGWD